MKITRVEVILLHDRFACLKVDTDAGIAGWGAGPRQERWDEPLFLIS